MVKKIIAKLDIFFKKRALVLLVVFSLMTLLLLSRLVDLQLIHGQNYADSFTVKTTATRTLKSSRGRIFDVNGKLLAYNELANNVTIEDNGSYDTTRERNLSLNGEIYTLTQMIRAKGDALSHDFHIVIDDSGNYAFDTTNEITLARFRADVYGYPTIDELSEEEASATAEEMMTALAGPKRFSIVITDKDKNYTPYTEEELSSHGLPTELTKEQILDIVIVRYQLSLVSYQRYMAVTVATNVSEETVAIVKEHQEELQGVSVSQDYIRKYVDSLAMAPIIGYTGKPSAEELETLQQQDAKYNNNSIIGKAGIEQYMETTLQGRDGSEEVTIDNLGTVVSENKGATVLPEQGDDVYLTIDSELQEACYHILEQRIAGILYLNLVDTKEVEETTLDNNDTVSVASYDCYYSMINNNILDTNHFSAQDASETEKAVLEKLTQKQASVLSELQDLFTSGSAVRYSNLSAEDKAYVDYIIEQFLTTKYGILDSSAINTEDEVYQQYFTDESISPQEYLRYACNHDWINMSRLVDYDNAYLTSAEIYQAVLDYISANLMKETDFNKLLYRHMLLTDDVTPRQIMQMLYDQGVLSTGDSYYERFERSDISPFELLTYCILDLTISPAMLALDPCAGSIVMTDPATGEVRACVTYPGYDNNRLANDMDVDYFTKLNTDLSTPFYNKATQQLSAPGSTYKPIMAAAGLTEHIVTSESGVNCTGRFGEDIEFLSDADRVHCWNTYGHGYLTVSSALEHSCNVMFCTIGYSLGLDKNDDYEQLRALEKEQEYTAMFGLSQTTGIQIPESEPHVTDSMPIPSAIGQGTHQYTTTQLARYVGTIANRGEVMALSLIHRTADTDGNTIQEYEPKTVAENQFSSEVWNNIFSGMGAAVSSDQIWSGFSNEIYVYGKTGTAQESMLRPDHALVIGFTKKQSSDIEYGDVAYAVRIANGYSSSNASLVARDALNYYFNLQDESEILTGTANTTDMVRQIVTD